MAATLTGALVSAPVLSHTDPTVVNRGGAAARVHMLALVRPFEELKGVTVNVEHYGGELDQVTGFGPQRADKLGAYFRSVRSDWSDPGSDSDRASGSRPEPAARPEDAAPASAPGPPSSAKRAAGARPLLSTPK